MATNVSERIHQIISRASRQAATRPEPQAGKPEPPEFSDRPLWEGDRP